MSHARIAFFSRVAATAIIALSMGFLAACENVDREMWDQQSFKTQETPRKFLPKGSVPTVGISDNYYDADPAELKPPFPLNAEAAKRGEKPYKIFCAPCHGIYGAADTVVAKAMDGMPPSLIDESVIERDDGSLFQKILSSDTIMPNFRNELTDNEAWDIVAHVRKLQSQSKK